MRQVVRLTSTYSSDEFGVCSALYELGGLVVMHDASGCNSTYTTHDEPRWYDMDSMIYISAISEMEAILGDDSKLIQDIVETSSRLKPKFIAIVGAPIPYMTGTDYDAISAIITEETGIPCFGFPTNGMQYYTQGVSLALAKITDYYCEGASQSSGGFDESESSVAQQVESNVIKVNILGATPLDFSINSTLDSIKKWISDSGMKLQACLAMGSTLEDIKTAGAADVNLVISYGGLESARILKDKFNIPYVAGVPFGARFSIILADRLKTAYENGENIVSYKDLLTASTDKSSKKILIIGESVISASLAASIRTENPEARLSVVCPVDTDSELIFDGMIIGEDASINDISIDEDDIEKYISQADIVIADPLYRPLCSGVKGQQRFIDFPHIAFSGRIFEKTMPDYISSDFEL